MKKEFKFLLLFLALLYLVWFIPQAMGYWFRWISLLAVPVLFFYARKLRVLAWISAILMLVVCCYSFIGLRFGPPSIGVMLSILNTNMAEAYEQSTAVPLNHIILFIISIICIVIYCRSIRQGSSSWLIWIIGFILLIPTLQNGLFFKRFRECVFYTIKHYREEKKELQQSLLITPDWKITSPYTQKGKIYVVVIGESARADYFSAYDYPIDTSPFLKGHASILFKDAVAPGSSTLLSVPRILSINEDIYRIRHGYDAVTLAHAAGLETWWISDQGYLGYSDSAITHIASRSDHPIFLQNGEFDSRNVDDFEIIAPFEKAVSTNKGRDKVIFIHTLGSHEDPCKRVGNYPLINIPGYKKHLQCYITSIRKTDDLIKRINEILLQSHHSYEIIYFADHGVKMTQDRMQHSPSTREAYHIPFVVIDSENKGNKTYNDLFDMHHFIDFFASQLGVETELTVADWTIYAGHELAIPPIDWDKEHSINLNTLESNPAITP